MFLNFELDPQLSIPLLASTWCATLCCLAAQGRSSNRPKYGNTTRASQGLHLTATFLPGASLPSHLATLQVDLRYDHQAGVLMSSEECAVHRL